MIYLSGATSDRDEPFLIGAGIGLMLNFGNSYHLRVDRYPFYGADIVGIANNTDPDRALERLDGLPRDRCLFVAAPDEYPDAVASLERGLSYAPLIRDMGFPVAIVAQDHAERLSWPWDEFDCLMIGGERKPNPRDEWKISAAAAQLAGRARQQGKWVHMGRVNSLDRIEIARSMGCNSCDGTFIKYRRRARATDCQGARDGRGAVEIGQWLIWLEQHPELPLRTYETPTLPIHKEALRAGCFDDEEGRT